MKKIIRHFPADDPRSALYPRVLVTPRLDWKGILLRCLLPIPVLVGLWVLLRLWLPQPLSICITAAAMLVYGLLNLKRMLITLVQLYQNFAPRKIRMKCRFEPSCSQYMVLSIEKHGVCLGLCKGIRRLSKCNDRGTGLNGGFDAP